MRKLMFIITTVVLILSLIGCVNPYQDTMQRTIPVIDNYESVLQGKQLTETQRNAYMLEAKTTKMAITEALKGKDGKYVAPENNQPQQTQGTAPGIYSTDAVILYVQYLTDQRKQIDDSLAKLQTAINSKK